MPLLVAPFKPRPLRVAGAALPKPGVAKNLRVLPGAMAQRGYRIGSRSRGSRSRREALSVKYYAAFKGARISPYFPTPMAAARWLTSKISA